MFPGWLHLEPDELIVYNCSPAQMRRCSACFHQWNMDVCLQQTQNLLFVLSPVTQKGFHNMLYIISLLELAILIHWSWTAQVFQVSLSTAESWQPHSLHSSLIPPFNLTGGFGSAGIERSWGSTLSSCSLPLDLTILGKKMKLSAPWLWSYHPALTDGDAVGWSEHMVNLLPQPLSRKKSLGWAWPVSQAQFLTGVFCHQKW